MIKVENLEAGFDGVKVLDQLNLSFAEGEIAAIIGPSGAGKSTLLRCLNFLAVPTSGKITIDGCTVDAGTVTGQEIYGSGEKQRWSFSSIVKGTALGFTIGLPDIMAKAKIEASLDLRFFEAYLCVTLIYLVLVICIEKIQGKIEKRLQKFG